MGFYKTGTRSMNKLNFPLDITFVRQKGIEARALNVGLFTNFLDKPNKNCLSMLKTNLYTLLLRGQVGLSNCSKL